MSECEINKADSLCTFLTSSIKIFAKKCIFVIILIRGLSHSLHNDRFQKVRSCQTVSIRTAFELSCLHQEKIKMVRRLQRCRYNSTGRGGGGGTASGPMRWTSLTTKCMWRYIYASTDYMDVRFYGSWYFFGFAASAVNWTLCLNIKHVWLKQPWLEYF
jgi:hypothetical protein